LHISPEFKAPLPVAPDTTFPPGKMWGDAISQKKPGIPPKVQ